MWGLEYALLFGIPNNKLELIYGRSRCAFPFLEREQAEAHFTDWIATLCRWQQVLEIPPIRKGRKRWRIRVKGFALELFPRPIDVRVPLDGDAFEAFHGTFWRREFWDGQPPGLALGWEWSQRHHDVQLNLWTLFGTLCRRYGGLHSGRVDIVLSDTTAVSPDQYYYRKSREECMIAGDYFHGAPDLIAEVLSPPSRAMDRGLRKELYRRAGVRHLWLLDPELESVDIYELTGPDYQLVATHRAGEEFRPTLFPEATVRVDGLFDTQWKRHPEWSAPSEPEPVPEWLLPADKRLGLEYLFLLGHPERRWEIWGNRAPCVLAFGSPGEAQLRFRHFLEEIGHWEQASVAKPSSLEPEVEQAEVGRFRLTRRGRHVFLEVAVDARHYRKLLEVWPRPEAWDWGEK